MIHWPNNHPNQLCEGFVAFSCLEGVGECSLTVSPFLKADIEVRDKEKSPSCDPKKLILSANFSC